ncbi:PREDICTED: peritrophin-44 [Rhagoletis zephyria]|uniref:peritrophin-44 n=1 Tax=Rhagoletis zephyria TaxID=28612 RepID=UPI0008119771|nr:PREDICTED: peritrophin-44 [Rhagoletis zephyria]
MHRKSLMRVILTFFCLYDLTQCNTILPDPAELCSLFEDGTRIRKPGSCTEYILCANSMGTTYSCPSNQKFDRAKQGCVLETNLTDTDDYCRNRCEGIDGKWITDPASCKGYLYCREGQPIQGYCENDYVFNENDAMCDFAENLSCNVVHEICDLVPEGTLYRNTADCSKYYKCTKGKSVSTSCARNTHYNVQTKTCGKQWLDDACVPTFSCGTSSRILKGFQSDGVTCRGYFYCRDFGTVRDLEPNYGRCPEGTFYDQTALACIDPLDSDCSYNRCQGRGNSYVQTNEDDCRNYIVCENGVEVKRQRCSGDQFFDEKMQVCVKSIVSYKCCDGK